MNNICSYLISTTSPMMFFFMKSHAVIQIATPDAREK